MATPKAVLAFYNSQKWKKVRRLKIQLARGVCEECGKAGYQVHHIKPINLGNLHNDNITCGLDNLQLLCASCHNAKRSEEAEIRSDITFDIHGNTIKKEAQRPTPRGSKTRKGL